MDNNKLAYLLSTHSLIVLVSYYLSVGTVLLFFCWLVILELGYYFFRKSCKNMNFDTTETTLRKQALESARIYLFPYKDIWKNLKISNKYCILRLGEVESDITCIEKVAPYRKFTLVKSNVYDYVTLWNVFCRHFSHNISYDGVVELCIRFMAEIEENIHSDTIEPSKSELEKSSIAIKPIVNNLDNNVNNIELPAKQKIDINNCSELELTELPGISIVMAKRAVKKREDVGGFKTVDGFFDYLKIKPHMQEQIRNKIVITKKEGAIPKIQYKERNLDI